MFCFFEASFQANPRKKNNENHHHLLFSKCGVGSKTQGTVFFVLCHRAPSSRVGFQGQVELLGQLLAFVSLGWVSIEVIVSYVSKLGYNSPIYGTYPIYLYREYNPLILSTMDIQYPTIIMECHKDLERLLAWSMWPQPKWFITASHIQSKIVLHI